MLSRVSKLTSVKILFIQIFQEGEDDKWTNCGRSQTLPLLRSDVSMLDLSISRTETLLRSTKTKRLMACLCKWQSQIGSKRGFRPCAEAHGGQNGERNICGTIDGRSGVLNSLKGRSVPYFARNGAFTHPSLPEPISQDLQ